MLIHSPGRSEAAPTSQSAMFKRKPLFPLSDEGHLLYQRSPMACDFLIVSGLVDLPSLDTRRLADEVFR